MFQQIMQREGVLQENLLASVVPEANKTQILKTNNKLKAGDSTNQGGSSGSFFFFTEDRKYMIKSMKREEVSNLLRMLPSLNSHF